MNAHNGFTVRPSPTPSDPMAAKPAGKLPAPPKKTAAPSKPTKATPGASTPTTKRRKVDWEAVERDYRTGKLTETELATKYGATRSAVNKQARTKGWQKDLRDEIKQATNARLVADLVAKEVAEGSKKVADTVLAAAEVNVQVILGHRSDIKAARDLAADLMQELAQSQLLAQDQEALVVILAGDTPDVQDRARMAVRKAMDIHNRINSVKSLAETFTKLQTLERKAFDLDNAPPPAGDPLTELLHEISSGNNSCFKPVLPNLPEDED